MAKEIFATQHTNGSAIRVIYGREVEAATGLDVVLNGRVVAREYSPEGVNKWFSQWSKANLAKWQKAYHASGLTPASYLKPMPPRDIVLKVPYLSQRDNERHPFGSCNVTCLAMVLSFLGAKRKGKSYRQFEDELEAYIQRNGRDRHVHSDLEWCARQYGMAARFRTDVTLDQIRAQIRSGFPVMVSTLLTRAGHIICLIGTKGDDFIVHDPFGQYGTKYKAHDGNSLIYSGRLMMSKMRAPNENAKWAHFIEPGGDG